MKKKLNARIEYAKFLQNTVAEMAKELKKSQSGDLRRTAEDLDGFMNKVCHSLSSSVSQSGHVSCNLSEHWCCMSWRITCYMLEIAMHDECWITRLFPLTYRCAQEELWETTNFSLLPNFSMTS